jgi:hypothetical protein
MAVVIIELDEDDIKQAVMEWCLNHQVGRATGSNKIELTLDVHEGQSKNTVSATIIIKEYRAK